MYCENCGNKLDDKDKICNKCKKEINKQIVESDVKLGDTFDLGNPSNYLIGLFLPIYRLILYFRLKKYKKTSARQILIGFLIYLLYLLCLISLSLSNIIMPFAVIFFTSLVLIVGILISEYKHINDLPNEIISKFESSDTKKIDQIKEEIYNKKVDSIILLSGAILILISLHFLISPIIVYWISYLAYVIGGAFCVMTAFLIPVGLELFEQAGQLEINFTHLNIYGFILFMFSGITLFIFSTFRKR